MMKFIRKKLLIIVYILMGTTIFQNSSLLGNEITTNKISNSYIRNIPKDDYILGTGDTLEITVVRELEDLKNSYTIDGMGTIYLPRLKKIRVSGLTVDELIPLLNSEYKTFIKNPEIELKIKSYRPISVYVDGEIANPGLYTAKGSYSPLAPKSNITNIDSNNLILSNNPESNLQLFFPRVFDILQLTGGITNYSDLSNIEITRINTLSQGGGKIKTNVNLFDLISGTNNQNIRIYDGDHIKVGRSDVPLTMQIINATKSNLNPKFINVLVSGNVENSGPLKVPNSSSIYDAIEMAGGLKVLSGKVKLISYNDGLVTRKSLTLKQVKKINYTNNLEFKLKNGDIIVVTKSSLKKSSELFNAIFTPLIVPLNTYNILSN